MFPCIISKTATVDVICHGEAPNKNGAVQLVSCLISLSAILVVVFFLMSKRQHTNIYVFLTTLNENFEINYSKIQY